VIVISAEYQATANEADEVIILRPGTDAALALGVARAIIDQELYDREFVKRFTDLPLLVRMDTLKKLQARDIIPDYQPASLSNFTRVLTPGEAGQPFRLQNAVETPQTLRESWDDAVVWDTRTNSPKPVSRDQVGEFFDTAALDPALQGAFEVTTRDGTKVQVRPVFSLEPEYLQAFDSRTVAELTWVPEEGIRRLARQAGDWSSIATRMSSSSMART